MDPAEAIEYLLKAVSLKKEEKYSYVTSKLDAFLRVSLSKASVKQILSDNLKLDSEMTQMLLDTIIKSRIDLSRPAISDFLALVGDGLLAEYKKKGLPSSPKMTRIDQEINFRWGSSRPFPDDSSKIGFSVKWTGRLLAEYSEVYTFYLYGHGNMSLTIDGKTLIKEERWQVPKNTVPHCLSN